MSRKVEREEWLQRRAAGWSDCAGRLFAGSTLYLLVSGLAIFALPFSVFNQHSVVLHTVVGVLAFVPALIYMARHLKSYWQYPMTHLKFSGYALSLLVLVCSISGFVLTWESVMTSRITYLWRTIHNVSTFGVLFFLLTHVVLILLRSKGEPGARSYSKLTLGIAAVLLVITGVATVAIQPVQMSNEFPEDYDHEAYPGKGPFAPSLATTTTGGALDSRTLSGSASCGTTNCHEGIYKEWLPSAHRYASLDAGFQAIQGVMAKQNGPSSTRYCGGCHDPISLFSGTKNIGIEDLTGLEGYQEGVSCLACHAIKQTDIKGNANYVITAPERYVYEQREGSVWKFLADFTIRAYPQKHIDTLSHRMFKTPEFCAACHKQFIDEEVNQVGWVQLQNQFDNWRASRWHDPENPERTIECRECHMPLQDSTDPAAGDDADYNRTLADGKHRSHSFLGGNQYLPLVHELEGAEEHVARTHQWLRGDIEIPEIAGKWSKGPAVPIELETPELATPGEPLELRVHIINNKVGHDFPTGPLDIIQAWLEIEVTDAKGQVVFHTGQRDEKNFIETGSYMFKAEPVDRYGNLIDRHNLWEMVGVRFKRSLFPGSEEVASFSFDCSGIAGDELDAPLDEAVDVPLPADLVGPLQVRASLNYRKFDQYLLNFVFGEDSGLTSPVTEMSSAEATIELAPKKE